MSIDEERAGALRALVAFKGGVFCERCKCCEMTWQVCESCHGQGYFDEDDDEDAAFPRVCDICEGEHGWYLCGCDEQGRHPPKEGT